MRRHEPGGQREPLDHAAARERLLATLRLTALQPGVFPPEPHRRFVARYTRDGENSPSGRPLVA